MDAAYGGFFLLTEYGRSALRGIERSSSVVLDPHKSLFLPLGFEVGPPPDLSIVTYRWAPPGASLEQIHEINQAIVDGFRRDGRIFLSSTLLDGKFTLRMAALAFRTHRRTIDLALEILRQQVGLGPQRVSQHGQRESPRGQ